MTTQIRDLRAELSQSEHEFGIMLGKVLSPSQPLHSEEFLRGRKEQLAGIKRAFYQPGRHVLNHGLRGVGKSSLAQAAAYSLSNRVDPIIAARDGKSSFGSIMREVFDEAVDANPTVERKVREVGGGFARFGISFGGKVSTHEVTATEPGSVY